jgi:isopenicillin-N epimerase
MLAPTGAGFLVFRAGNEDRLGPLHVSWGYRPDQYPLGEQGLAKREPDARDPFGSTPRTRYLEFEGTRDICQWLAVPDAIDYQAAIGVQKIRGRIAELSHTPASESALGLKWRRRREVECGSMTAFDCRSKGRQRRRQRQEIWKHRIEVPVVERPDRCCFGDARYARMTRSSAGSSFARCVAKAADPRKRPI